MSAKMTREELSGEQRWQERYGDSIVNLGGIKVVNLRDASLFAKAQPGQVIIGDEILGEKDLQQSHAINPQPAEHPFKPHHYLTQKEMDIILAASKRGLK